MTTLNRLDQFGLQQSHGYQQGDMAYFYNKGQWQQLPTIPREFEFAVGGRGGGSSGITITPQLSALQEIYKHREQQVLEQMQQNKGLRR